MYLVRYRGRTKTDVAVGKLNKFGVFLRRATMSLKYLCALCALLHELPDVRSHRDVGNVAGVKTASCSGYCTRERE